MEKKRRKTARGNAVQNDDEMIQIPKGFSTTDNSTVIDTVEQLQLVF